MKQRISPVDRPSEELAALLAEERKIIARFDAIQIEKAQKRAEIAAAAAASSASDDQGGAGEGTFRVMNLVTGRAMTDKERVRAHVLRLEPGSEFTTRELADALKIKTNSASAYLSELKTDGLVARAGTSRGRYRVVARDLEVMP